MADSEDASPSERLKVFVSYSRTDLDFADELVRVLEDKGYETLLDRHDIDGAENWKDRLSTLIRSCDTVVFVLTEGSAGSPICKWEVEEAARLGKRMIPVTPRDPGGVQPPPQLAALNYIPFYKNPTVPDTSFYQGVRALDRALKVNLGWLRRQTSYAEQATAWATDKSVDRVLGGKPLEEALQWRASAPKDAVISPLVLEYLAASETALARRKAEADADIAAREKAQADKEVALRRLSRRTTLGLVVAGALATTAGGLALWVANAEERARRDRDRAQEAEARSLESAIEREAQRRDIAGQFTAYAAAPGQAADDSDVYSNRLLEALSDRNASLLAGLSAAHADVFRDNHGQRPFFSSDLNGDVYLGRNSRTRRLKAIVVSVDTFGPLRLESVRAEGRQWDKFLSDRGFEVSRLENPTHSEILRAVSSLAFPSSQGTQSETGAVTPVAPDSLAPTATASGAAATSPARDALTFFLFAGGGFSLDGENLLVASDYHETTLGLPGPGTVRLSEIQSLLRQKSAASILVLDTNFAPASYINAVMQ